VNCFALWNRHVIELSSEFTTTLLVETVFTVLLMMEMMMPETC
jgi:hypothetical protein